MKMWTDLSRGEAACGLFLDLQKGFNRVDHSILLSKLQHYGIRSNAFNWFIYYWFVSVGGSSSSSNVPQGSVLGSLLFLICVNDMYRQSGTTAN